MNCYQQQARLCFVKCFSSTRMFCSLWSCHACILTFQNVWSSTFHKAYPAFFHSFNNLFLSVCVFGFLYIYIHYFEERSLGSTAVTNPLHGAEIISVVLMLSMGWRSRWTLHQTSMGQSFKKKTCRKEILLALHTTKEKRKVQVELQKHLCTCLSLPFWPSSFFPFPFQRHLENNIL